MCNVLIEVAFVLSKWKTLKFYVVVSLMFGVFVFIVRFVKFSNSIENIRWDGKCTKAIDRHTLDIGWYILNILNDSFSLFHTHIVKKLRMANFYIPEGYKSKGV